MKKEELVVVKFRELINKLSWFNKIKMEDRLKGYKSVEVHYIECIGSHSEPNVTKIAEVLYMTRGAISKMTKKLEQKGLIESYQKPENKKEIYFRLTKSGQDVYDIHEKLHREFRDRDRVVFEGITEEQYDNMLAFIRKYNEHLDSEISKINQGDMFTNK
jgi:DNA-binding MarR family transcriptional regulator